MTRCGGAAYLIPGKNRYTRFRIIAWQPPNSDDPPLPAYQPISERPLTAEEIAHFERLAQTYSPKTAFLPAPKPA